MTVTRRFAALVLIAVSALSACGGSSTRGSAQGTASSSPGASAGGGVAAAVQKLDALYQGVTFKNPPSDVVGHATGKNIWLIDISLAATEGTLVARAAQQAARSLGWKLTVYDGQFVPSRFLDGVRQAIAAKADGIFLYAVDCAGIKAALQQAKAAGIKVATAESSDCGTPGQGALFDGSVSYTQGNFQQWAASAGAADADWIIAKTNGKAQVINLYENDTNSTKAINDGFINEMKTCATCRILETVTFTGADIGSSLQQKTGQALVSHPTATVLMAPYDGVMATGVAAAVRSAGRTNNLFVVAGGGTAPALDLVRQNQGETAGYCTSLDWEGWAGLDILNRLFQGKPLAPSGIGMQVFDKYHNIPASGGWQPAIDFKSAYMTSWQTH